MKLMMRWNQQREEILWLSPPKAARMNAFLKNQYKRTLCEVTMIITTEYCNQ